MESEAAWHGVGHRLAPKEPWAHVLDKPGMLRLEMRGERPDDLLGYIRIRVEPSQRVRPGVFINVNDHYELSDTDTSRGCGEIMDILRRVWKDSVERAARMAHELLEIA